MVGWEEGEWWMGGGEECWDGEVGRVVGWGGSGKKWSETIPVSTQH